MVIGDSIALIGKTHPDLTSVAGWEEIAHRATEVSLLPKIYTRVSKLYEWKYGSIMRRFIFFSLLVDTVLKTSDMQQRTSSFSL